MGERDGYRVGWCLGWLIAGLTTAHGWWGHDYAWTQESPPAGSTAFHGGDSGQVPQRSEAYLSDERIVWRTIDGSEPWPESVVVIENLPNPPEALQSVIETGRVEFRFYEADKMPRRFAGETRMAMVYRLEYTYRARLIRVGGKRRLQVKLQYRPTQFTRLHQILLPIAHAHVGMFEVPLVLHELDHVRIGIDPRYPALFDQWLQETTENLTFDGNAEVGEAELEAWVQREVDDQATACFARLMQLMEVRQRELDRVTEHGLQPLPVDFFATPKAAPTVDR